MNNLKLSTNIDLTKETNDVVINLSLSKFLKSLSELDMSLKKVAYQRLLTEFLLFINKRTNDNGRLLIKEVAYDLHNLPYFLANGMKKFDERLFWENIWNFHFEKELIVSLFLNGLQTRV